MGLQKFRPHQILQVQWIFAGQRLLDVLGVGNGSERSDGCTRSLFCPRVRRYPTYPYRQLHEIATGTGTKVFTLTEYVILRHRDSGFKPPIRHLLRDSKGKACLELPSATGTHVIDVKDCDYVASSNQPAKLSEFYFLFALGPIPRSLLRLGWLNVFEFGLDDWRISWRWSFQMPRGLPRGCLLLSAVRANTAAAASRCLGAGIRWLGLGGIGAVSHGRGDTSAFSHSSVRVLVFRDERERMWR